MNRERRKTLNVLMDKLSEIRDELESAKYDEEEYRDNIPENLQGSERYERAEEACSQLEEALDYIDSAIANIETASE